MTKTQEPIKRGNHEAKLADLTNHVRHIIIYAARTKGTIMKDQAEIRVIIAEDHGEDRGKWAHVYHDNARRLEVVQERIVTLAPVLEMLTGQTPADILETK